MSLRLQTLQRNCSGAGDKKRWDWTPGAKCAPDAVSVAGWAVKLKLSPALFSHKL